MVRNIWAVLVVFLAAWTINPAGAEPAPLRSIAAIRAVDEWSELSPHPLAIEGVVTFVDRSRNLVVLQDGMNVIAFDLGDARLNVTPGERIVLTASDSRPFLPDLPRYPRRPSRREWLTSFESVPTAQNGFYVARFRGYVYPPVTGAYRFAIASDDASQLLLGADENPASRRTIARVDSFTRQRDWTRTAPQRSEPIFLEAGHAYYIEAIHQQAGGATHLSVAWEGPGTPLGVIPGNCLSPWVLAADSATRDTSSPPGPGLKGTVLREVWDDVTVDSVDVMSAPRKLRSTLSIDHAAVDVLGTGHFPAPVNMYPGQAMMENEDFRWCELEGTVDFVGAADNRLRLELSDKGKRVEAIVNGWAQAVPSALRGKRVRVVGAAESVYTYSGARELGRIWVRPSSPFAVTKESPPAELARLVALSDLVNGDRTIFREAPVKIVGKIVDAHGDQLTVSDHGTFTASVSNDGVAWRPVGTPVEVAMGPVVYLGLAVNSRAPTARSEAVFSHVSGLSRGAVLTDIGSPSSAGTFTSNGDSFRVTGVGSDIWNAPDQFTFVYQALEGAGTIVAHLQSFTPADPAARAGIMIRESLTPDAQFVDLIQTADTEPPSVSMQWRKLVVGGAIGSVSDLSRPGAPPSWLKLERRFNTVRVNANHGAAFADGETVDVVGYVQEQNGAPVIVNASVSRHAGEQPLPTTTEKWRPLVEIARVCDDTHKWGGFDYFRVNGVVTFCGDVLGRHYWAVQDRSAGTLLTGRDPSNIFRLKPGAFVEVCSSPGWFAPTNNFYADNAFILGPGIFPEPIRHPGEYLLPKRGEGTWVELEGIVRSVADNGLLEVKARGDVFVVAVSGAQPAQFRSWIDADVRIRGVIVYPNERERLLLVPSAENLEALGAPQHDPFTAPLETTRTLTAGSILNQSRHRIRMTGTVTYADRTLVYLQDEFGGVRVELEKPESVAVGTLFEVVGFPDWAEEDGAVLRHALGRAGPKASPIKPIALNPREAAFGRYAFQLVRVRASVSRALSTPDGTALELGAGQQVFRVELPSDRGALDLLPTGSLVEITGVNLNEAGPLGLGRASTKYSSILPLKLLLRSPADVAVLQKPSWWVLKRTLLALGFIGAASLVAVIWIHHLRRRIRQRTAELAATMKKLEQEARMSATLAERERVAGEIHDSVEQGLNGLLLHLESMAGTESCPPAIRSGLSLARNIAVFSRTEVQNAVWELQSPLLEDSELSTAIEKIMRQIVPDTLHATIRVEGDPRRLASIIEHHLLRIAQEAINNTVKHAHAHHLDVLLRYEPGAVVLNVTDDGHGFIPGEVPTGGLGHFGLRSLRSRAGKMRAAFEVVSAPGKGTTLRIRVPTSPV